ncbi:radical SAM protein [candidate division KSB1 bacterium]
MIEAFTTYTASDGEIYDSPEFGAVGCSAHHFVLPSEKELIPLPEGSKFFTMPDHLPYGVEKDSEIICPVDNGNEGLTAVAAFLPPGYTRLLLPAAQYRTGNRILPLWAYTALFWKDNNFWVPAVKIDDNSKWDPGKYDDSDLDDLIVDKAERLKDNRLVQQLSICAKEYHCFAAKNFFMERWEAPAPTSPVCNANCIGCISFQPGGECPASMDRLKFIPTPTEIAEVAIDHFRNADDPLISFGQGCEGEPLMQFGVIERAIKKIKGQGPVGTVNMNTNASKPIFVKRLCDAGLDSIRITLNSAREKIYNLYHRPEDYSFNDVVNSIKTASDDGLFVTLNLLVFPGITDQQEEIDTLIPLLKDTGVNLIQMKNLNIDSAYYLDAVGYPAKPGTGILQMMDVIKHEIPAMRFGYFNRARSDF